MSAADHMARVRQLDCVVCDQRLGVRNRQVETHHAGLASDKNDWLVVPLCPEHHRGATGVHGLHRKPFDRLWKCNDMLMLAWTQEALSKS